MHASTFQPRNKTCRLMWQRAGWQSRKECLIFVDHFPPKSPEISVPVRKATCNYARGEWRGFCPRAAARHRGRTRAPADGASELSFFMFPLEIGRLRRPISHRTSPPDVQLHIGCLLLLPASCLEVRSEIGRLPTWNVRFEIGHWTLGSLLRIQWLFCGYVGVYLDICFALVGFFCRYVGFFDMRMHRMHLLITPPPYPCAAHTAKRSWQWPKQSRFCPRTHLTRSSWKRSDEGLFSFSSFFSLLSSYPSDTKLLKRVRLGQFVKFRFRECGSLVPRSDTLVLKPLGHEALNQGQKGRFFRRVMFRGCGLFLWRSVVFKEFGVLWGSYSLSYSLVFDGSLLCVSFVGFFGESISRVYYVGLLWFSFVRVLCWSLLTRWSRHRYTSLSRRRSRTAKTWKQITTCSPAWSKKLPRSRCVYTRTHTHTRTHAHAHTLSMYIESI